MIIEGKVMIVYVMDMIVIENYYLLNIITGLKNYIRNTKVRAYQALIF